jgi:hypothetical protein
MAHRIVRASSRRAIGKLLQVCITLDTSIINIFLKDYIVVFYASAYNITIDKVMELKIWKLPC